MLQEPCPHAVSSLLPVRARNPACRPVLPQRPDESAPMRAAAGNRWLHGPDRGHVAADLAGRADTPEAG